MRQFTKVIYPPKSQFITKCLSPTFFRNPKGYHESKTKSSTSCPVCPQSRIKLSDIDDNEKDEIIQFLREKKPTKCKCYIHLLFFVYSFVYISLLLFCLFSVVRRTQKLNLKLPPLIAFVMSFRAGKMWLFHSKLELNMVFSWAGFSTFPLVLSFHDFSFLLFQ